MIRLSLERELEHLELAQRWGLEYFRKFPELLIPQRLREIINPAKLRAASFPIWYGRMDQEYQPTVAMIIAEKDGTNKDPSKSNCSTDLWSRTLEYHFNSAVSSGNLNLGDEPLLLFVAHEHLLTRCIDEKYERESAVEIQWFIECERIRRKGIGKDFFGRLEVYLKEMHYKYLWGDNRLSNPEIFQKMGRYKADQLDLEMIKYEPFVKRFGDISTTTVKFLDIELEKRWARKN